MNELDKLYEAFWETRKRFIHAPTMDTYEAERRAWEAYEKAREQKNARPEVQR